MCFPSQRRVLLRCREHVGPGLGKYLRDSRPVQRQRQSGCDGHDEATGIYLACLVWI